MSERQLPKYLQTKRGYKLAYHAISGAAVDQRPGFIWCGGLKSDMEGSKALAMQDWAKHMGHDYVRFDYFGHGQSDGEFAAGNISIWRDDIVSVLDELSSGPQVLMGSSMGGWASLLAAKARPERVKALLLIAPAPDFTQHMWDSFDKQVQNQIMKDGLYLLPNEYDEPYEITRQLIEDGRANSLLGKVINFDGPVRILQGQDDVPVPWRRSIELVDQISSKDVIYNLVKGGDHSLSRDNDLLRLKMWAADLSNLVSSSSV